MSWKQAMQKLTEEFIVDGEQYLNERYWQLYYRIREELQELEKLRKRRKEKK
ncbi:unnamed protein product [marine sediment metagenome]|uniref:Uncharacterized protein n=1 Tax=marine sediment metagenome TaxID=412755 RepID=X1C813_9ZZZZ